MTSEERFSALYARCFDAVERYIVRRAPERAPETVAEVFLVAWRRLSEVPEPALPWLYGVARRVLANDKRQRDRHDRLADRVAGQPPQDVPDHAEAVVDRMSIASAFDKLPEAEQEALRLVAWEDLPMAAAAQAAGCSISAFAMRLHRARKRLRRQIGAQVVGLETVRTAVKARERTPS